MSESNGNNRRQQEHVPPAAVTYAQALLDLADERQQADTIAHELRGLEAVLQKDRLFGAFFSDPAITETEREGVITRAFKGTLSPLMMNFLAVLNQKGRTGLLPQIIAAYDDLLDAQQGKIEVDVTVAQRLSDQELEQVRQKISQALNKEAVIHQYVDDSIIGGLVLRVQDKLIDGSVRYQLQAMREQLLASKPK